MTDKRYKCYAQVHRITSKFISRINTVINPYKITNLNQ